jgi:excinuclease UvrABC nuclease subunit
MPFNYGPYPFNEAGINSMVESGGVYGLAKPNRGTSPLTYTILYVGKSGNLRQRLREHLNNPPASGITHFFAESIGTDAARTQREYVLIQEFKPVGNTLLK